MYIYIRWVEDVSQGERDEGDEGDAGEEGRLLEREGEEGE